MKRFFLLFTAVIFTVLIFSIETPFASSELSGTVSETMNSGGYTYVLLDTNGEKIWVAVQQISVKKGQNITFRPGATMENFESKTLKRTFNKIIFSDGIVTPAPTKDDSQTTGSKGKVVSKEKIKIDKATGANAHTIDEVYANIDKLDKKPVVVRGKVVKVSSAIMDKNWIHLQDGTGDEQKGSHNLVFTTTDTAVAGDIVTASGTLAKDRDFGQGYKYHAIVENASIKK